MNKQELEQTQHMQNLNRIRQAVELRAELQIWKDRAIKAESGWDLQSNELAKVKAERDTAWAELKEIREAIQANPEESTADEVRRVIAQKTPIQMVDLGLMRNPNYEPT